MIAPAAPPTTEPMIAPLAVEPVWLPITPPTAAPVAAPITAPSCFLFILAHALAPTEPITRSAARACSRCVFDIFMYRTHLRDGSPIIYNSGATLLGAPAQ